MNPIIIRRAIISVSDKTGIVEFAKRLQQWNIEIISTGGTLKTLREAGVHATSISDVTGFPEILDGRVKTLHPKIHGGLLAVSEDKHHARQLEELEIESIDMVVVNLYPFEQTVASNGVSLDVAIEQIDIGGPTMLRAAAKNFKYKTVLSNPGRYESIVSEMEKNNGTISEETRFQLAKEVFLHTSRYDTVISNYLEQYGKKSERPSLPNFFTLALPKKEDLRYGENPHQTAALYGNFHAYFEKLHGKELSYNNIVDIQAAAEIVEEFDDPTVVIIKHTNPCGVGSAPALADAYTKAFATDTKSAFGGIVAVNRVLDMSTAQQVDKVFTEVIIAPGFSDGVLEFLRKKKDRRLVKQRAALRSQTQLVIKQIAGGVLLQTPDDLGFIPEQLTIVTKRAPTDNERASMMFAWRVAKHVKSNAIVYARTDCTVGVGAGQMSRFDSSRIAVLKAQEAGLELRGTAVASDAFFPFADGLLEAVKAGATAVIQPGGSVRDEEVIKAADDNNIAMIFTGVRHFKH
ncbi:MAG: bifunctional phosphoribosylaminoimidazolecarboxamide formyltransferase/IMP cyclohydrolase [Ignavibacteria bacterium]|nr:bifunctional phosphoribosylaminoimidazolecarboxamide formyltransferase/IMP cyclohydrolase [Ignavibacteria bacterium]MBI3766193.1 bifunctional phosphoribosylaminoimidazolecarboxamide formyltransferase/IMP cyclohydrolase [Ignavibacteriales bacterium]